jgi:hypothetical protein
MLRFESVTAQSAKSSAFATRYHPFDLTESWPFRPSRSIHLVDISGDFPRKRTLRLGSRLLSSKMRSRVSVTCTKIGIYMKTTCAGLMRWPTLALPRVLPRFEDLDGRVYGRIWPNAPQRKYRDSSDLAWETSSPRIPGNISQHSR